MPALNNLKTLSAVSILLLSIYSDETHVSSRYPPLIITVCKLQPQKNTQHAHTRAHNSLPAPVKSLWKWPDVTLPQCSRAP